MRSTLSGTARQARRRASAPIFNPGLNSVAHFFCPSVTPKRGPGSLPQWRAPTAQRVPLVAPQQDRKSLQMLPMQYGAPCMPGAIRREHPAHWLHPRNQQRQSAPHVLSLLLDKPPVFSRQWLSAKCRSLISCRRPADCTPPATKAAGGAGTHAPCLTLKHTTQDSANLGAAPGLLRPGNRGEGAKGKGSSLYIQTSGTALHSYSNNRLGLLANQTPFPHQPTPLDLPVLDNTASSCAMTINTHH